MSMHADFPQTLALSVVAFSLSAYALIVFAGVLASRFAQAPGLRSRPGVSILKPLAGIDDGLFENLESFARIDYPDYELLLGVASAADPAYELAARFVAAHPSLRCRVLLTRRSTAGNPKIAQLIQLERAARFDILIISDSNVRASSDYLSGLVGELSKPAVAMTSSPVVGTGERTFGAAMENLQLAAHLAPVVLTSWRWIRHPISVGKSIAVRRSALRAVGGFASLGNVLAEDYMLGRTLSMAGFGVTVTHRPVENWNIDCSFHRTLERHARWAKMRRSIAPLAFALEPLLSPLLVATFGFLLVPTRATVAAVLGVAIVQTLTALLSVRLLRGAPLAWRWAPMEVALSFVGFYCWLVAWFSRRVEWRGNSFVLGADSRITPCPCASSMRLSYPLRRLRFWRSARIDGPVRA